ncbi:GNAT family N-acetyltransferase [Maricurvus nonylphenolicus]|uniref:GNAT family N-acetyltransferase n=1 Tax=Maricurvus nonylphenolicus TaxID=1008307 RepID=UPI0036F3ADED
MIIKIIDWEIESSAATNLRREVFIVEQKVPESDELDNQDQHATHFIGIDPTTNTVTACARLLNSGQIGRVAVKKEFRHRGYGQQLMDYIIEYATQNNYPTLFLHAQVQTQAFYRKLGFSPVGDTFMDAGILHQSMQIAEDTAGEN